MVYVFIQSLVIPVHGFSKNTFHISDTSNEPYEYHTYQSMTNVLHSLAENYSDILSLTSIGTTYGKRQIWMVKLSDNPNVEEEEPGVLLMGAHHGNEKPSYESLIFFIQYMVESYGKSNIDNDNDGLINEDIVDGIDNDQDGMIDEDPSEDRVREIIDNTQIFVIPMVNPDGVEYGWRKNRAPNYGPLGMSDEITSYGVDLNRNYGYKWYLYYIFPIQYHLAFTFYDNSWNYRGEYPFSENETRAVKEFVEAHDIIISLSYHSFGEFILYPWMHTSLPTPDEDIFISIGENISRVNGYFLYTGGNYVIPRFGGTLGTSENWLYGVHRIISYTIELCKSRAPTNPSVVYDYCMKHVGVNMYVCERAWTLEQELKRKT